MSHHSTLSLSLLTSPAAIGLLNVRDKIRTPGVRYLSKQELIDFGDSWMDDVLCQMKTERHLLPQERSGLEQSVVSGLATIAIDTTNNKFAGCLILWDLGNDEFGRPWFEIGSFLVMPDYRFRSGTKKAMPIGDALYRRVLNNNRDKNILGTTTNRSAVRTGQRHGMQMILFQQLPSTIEVATCICSSAKTLSDCPSECKIKDVVCRVRVSFPTWIRLGKPTRVNWPK